MSNLADLANIGANEDARSWALRMAHYGVVGAGVGMLLLILLVLLNLALIVSVLRLRRDIQGLKQLDRRGSTPAHLP